MFFLLSKLLLFILSPIVWILSLLGFVIFTKSAKLRKMGLVIAFALLLFFSNSFILDEVLRKWETGYVNSQNIEVVYDYGILLGGMGEIDKNYERINFNNGADRLIQTIVLYNKGIIKNIIIASGSGSILHQDLKEADYIKDYIIHMGIPDSCIILENGSRNTYENAIYTKKLSKNFSSNTSYLLITSAFHMRRATNCFKRAGFNFDIYAVNKLSGPRKYEFDHMFVPNKDAFFYWDVLIHEIAGFLVYKLIGYA